MARERGLDKTSFEQRDLNLKPPHDVDGERFDIVTCFEPLEHVADYRRSFEHLVAAAKPGGVIIVAVPNETGLPGLAKFCGRYVSRSDPYGDFFEDQSRARYIGRLVAGSWIEGFRKTTTKGYGPHLGFDYRLLLDHVDATYVADGRLSLIEQQTAYLGMNMLLVYRVAQDV